MLRDGGHEFLRDRSVLRVDEQIRPLVIAGQHEHFRSAVSVIIVGTKAAAIRNDDQIRFLTGWF